MTPIGVEWEGHLSSCINVVSWNSYIGSNFISLCRLWVYLIFGFFFFLCFQVVNDSLNPVWTQNFLLCCWGWIAWYIWEGKDNLLLWSIGFSFVINIRSNKLAWTIKYCMRGRETRIPRLYGNPTLIKGSSSY